MWDRLILGARLATLVPGARPWGLVDDGAIGLVDGMIAWVGPAHALADAPERLARSVHRVGGRVVTPGLVDCHTHLVFGGSRVAEFERRLGGASYEQIAREGGGILSTVRATRAADEAALVAAAAPRLDALLDEGVTTVEIKSGYGLELETELRMLRAARALGRAHPVEVVTTFLGAHALPPEHADDREAYLRVVLDEMLPAVARARLADACDVFLERIAFTRDEADRVLARARSLGLAVKVHADQLSDGGGAALAAAHRGLSADHLEYTSDDGVRAMAAAGTVAVLLPGAFLELGETRRPPIPALRAHGVPMALASDLNPGSSPHRSILATAHLGCTLFRLTPEEAIAGITREGARALGLADDRGTLEVGKRGDLVVWDIAEPAELAYWLGGNPRVAVLRGGEVTRGALP